MSPIIKRGVDEVEKHAKPAIQRAVKTAVDEVEKQAQPVIDRTEKRIHRNTGKLIAKYCAAGLGGIVSVCVLRQIITRATQGSESGLGGWLHKQNEGPTFAADAMIGMLIGAGLYGLYESQVDG
jgi:hypothetical protein